MDIQAAIEKTTHIQRMCCTMLTRTDFSPPCVASAVDMFEN